MPSIKRFIAVTATVTSAFIAATPGSSWSDDGHHGKNRSEESGHKKSDHSDSKSGSSKRSSPEPTSSTSSSSTTTSSTTPTTMPSRPEPSNSGEGRPGEIKQPSVQPKPAESGVKVDLANFACTTTNTGIWQPIVDEQTGRGNHDNLVLTRTVSTVRPGDSFHLTAKWEIRDWTPGTPITLRNCNDIDGPAEQNGQANAPHQSFGTNLPDRTVIQPAHSLLSYIVHGERRELASAELAFTVPSTAPVGGEFCSRVATFTDANGSGHRFSPPLFDISPTLCVPIVAPVAPPVEVQTGPVADTMVGPVAPAPEVVQAKITVAPATAMLPKTGTPIVLETVVSGVLLVTGYLLLIAGMGHGLRRNRRRHRKTCS